MLLRTLKFAFLTCALITFAAQSANAQTSRVYFAGYLGLNTYNDQEFSEGSTNNVGDFEIDSAPSFAGALGIRLSRQVRFETELSYRNADFSSVDIAGQGGFGAGGEIDSTILMASLFYDFDVPWKVQPYIGGGLGYGWHGGQIEDGSGLLPNGDIDDADFIWNAALGFKYRPRSDFAFNVGYRYLDSFDLSVDDYELDYLSHEFRLGFEWDLPTR